MHAPNGRPGASADPPCASTPTYAVSTPFQGTSTARLTPVFDESIIDPQLRSPSESSDEQRSSNGSSSDERPHIKAILSPAKFGDGDHASPDGLHAHEDPGDDTPLAGPSNVRRSPRKHAPRRLLTRVLESGPNPFLSPHQNYFPAYNPTSGERIGLEHTRGEGFRSSNGYYRRHVHEYDSSRNASLLVPAHAQSAVHGSEMIQNIPNAEPSYSRMPAPQRTVLEPLEVTRGTTPTTLSDLADPRPGERPEYTLQVLVGLAIQQTPLNMASLSHITRSIQDRFPFFRSGKGSKTFAGSVRHMLSLKRCFIPVPKPAHEPGKGGYWTVDFSREGNKRPRKRNTGGKGKKKSASVGKAAEHEYPMASGTESGGPDEPQLLDPTLMQGPNLRSLVPPPGSQAAYALTPSDHTFVPSLPDHGPRPDTGGVGPHRGRIAHSSARNSPYPSLRMPSSRSGSPESSNSGSKYGSNSTANFGSGQNDYDSPVEGSPPPTMYHPGPTHHSAYALLLPAGQYHDHFQRGGPPSGSYLSSHTSGPFGAPSFGASSFPAPPGQPYAPAAPVAGPSRPSPAEITRTRSGGFLNYSAPERTASFTSGEGAAPLPPFQRRRDDVQVIDNGPNGLPVARRKGPPRAARKGRS
ncbi:hypothetical protein DFH11DRAFT_873465 [Phellopilus nigrolimitatus]|nr:hypothetical protein DFH11DRAFT_873465 [Phellopilus nigrolimitatus]